MASHRSDGVKSTMSTSGCELVENSIRTAAIRIVDCGTFDIIGFRSAQSPHSKGLDSNCPWRKMTDS